MPRKPERPLAPHVQAAIAAGAQRKKGGVPPRRQIAVHVRMAITGPLQAKVQAPPGGDWPLAPHVRAAVAGGLGGRMYPNDTGRRVVPASFSVYQCSSFDLDKQKRPSFREDVKVHFLDQFKAGKNPITQKTERYYQCVHCKNWVQYEGIQLGHKIDWKTYAQIQGVSTREELIDAFNDISNIQLECSTCNQSHDFERTPAGDFKH